ncbi:hypothetical protein L810_3637 [Burkholderia sp. AU4i]|nr:hypothetical protein L810_3637 [Burkholderia sp. AU4i]
MLIEGGSRLHGVSVVVPRLVVRRSRSSIVMRRFIMYR